MGRIPKPPEDRDRRNLTPGIEDVVSLHTIRGLPEMPEWLDDDFAEQWQDVWESDIARTYRDQDYPLVYELFNLRQKMLNFEEQIDADGLMINGKPHLLMRECDTLRKHMRTIENNLLLSPMARRKAGLALGDVETGGALEVLKVDFKAQTDEDIRTTSDSMGGS